MAHAARTIYLATKNPHKLQELAAIIGSAAQFDLRLSSTLAAELAWVEDGVTFAENALIKARVVKSLTDAAVLADDSGLVVDYLGGAPGIYSSRYAGPEASDADNNRKLLTALAAVPRAQRRAKFICTLAFIDEAGAESVFSGEIAGELLTAAEGLGGFGYDPLFLYEPLGKTLAQLSAAEKNSLSHRAQAVQAWLQAICPSPS